jgi:hypothetical protein
MVASLPRTRWQAELGANRIMVAFWREHAADAPAPATTVRLANFVVQPATVPALLPERLPITIESYFNESLKIIEKNPLLYAGFQKHMVRQAMAEQPTPRFRELVASTWPSTA